MFKCINKNKPIAGQDAHWFGFCKKCKDYSSMVSRGGFKNNGLEHCYDCGHEQKTEGFSEKDIEASIISSWCHWQKWARIPYNWHELSEEQKFAALRDRPKKR